MVIKFVSSPGSMYEVAPGLAAQEAADAGLTVVEYAYSTNPPTPIYGRYKDAPEGSAIGVTVDDTRGTKVIGGGSVLIVPNVIGGSKGDLVNPNDPFVHGATGGDSMHRDGADAVVRDLAAEAKELAAVIEENNAASAKKSAK